MRKILLRFSGLVVILALAIPGLVLAIPVSAASGLNITGSIYIQDVSPGNTYVHTITIGSGSSSPLDIQVEADGFGQNPDGSVMALSPQEDDSPYSARPFITGIDQPSFQLEPNGSQEVNVTMSIPAGAAPGERYAVVHIHSQPGGDGKVGVIVASDIPIILNVVGSTPTEMGQITDLNVPKVESGKPLKVNTLFRNTGTGRLQVKDRVRVTDESGQSILESETALTTPSIIPTCSRLLTALFSLSDPAQGLAPGRYSVESVVALSDGTVLDDKKTTLEIAAEQAEPVGSVAEVTPASPSAAPSAQGVGLSMNAIIITAIAVAGAIVVALIVTRRRNQGAGRSR